MRGGIQINAKLTIQERLKDLRVNDRRLTLEQLAEATGLARSTLGNYETNDYKDISPFNAFNVLTIRHILCNPKYKGWYCANKSQTVDYRSKRKVFLDESEWVMYPDPSIPSIVSEELWDRANALYKRRSQQMMSHQNAAEFHNRYPYSGKIICEEHGTSFHSQLLKSAKGEKEVWQCQIYRNKGRKACTAPQVRTAELDQIMADIFNQVVYHRSKLFPKLFLAKSFPPILILVS